MKQLTYMSVCVYVSFSIHSMKYMHYPETYPEAYWSV